MEIFDFLKKLFLKTQKFREYSIGTKEYDQNYSLNLNQSNFD